MGDNKRKLDLEDEMSRFEQEIAGNLPPPPKIANMAGPPPPWMQGPPRLPFPGPPPVFRPPPQMDGSMMGPQMGPAMGPPMGPPGFMHPPPHMMVPPPVMMASQSPMGLPRHLNQGPRANTGEIVPPTVPLHNNESVGPDSQEYYDMPGTSEETYSSETKKKKEKKKTVVRVAGGQVWEDETLMDWDNNDFRIFVGDLGNEVSDDALLRAFSRYPSVLKAKVIREKKTKKTRGFGFVSFKDPQDYLKAMREMNGKYVGNRPVKLRKSTWKDRNINNAKKKEKEKKKLGLR